MHLEKYLKDNKENLVKKWFCVVFETYPKDAARFLKNCSDPFANPVGATIGQSLDRLFDEIIKVEPDKTVLSSAVDPIIRVRAVQELTPAAALSFIFDIKRIIVKGLSGFIREKGVEEYLAGIESNVDALMLTAVDIYCACRQKVYSLRINEEKQRVRQLLIKKDLMKEFPETDDVLKSG